ncbi:phage shock protein PspC (stress-responsive transcriptional regulator) [Dysgonomonas hofstadii]|uniref:Phage shock protein PspC (Stress-responsive transcriptional regulator) n=1 Tax=Dysgonomonas hofstadii TaxID=637886 RepID=A0A840CJI2_9BACT|nr:PspC domain-containing protein [Dysgonomonas hofstadii]MBB4036120.1 phage shock protein PspC (stress-responsive transcriptional regulator) [Dysgonomonas hofstadii]
MKPTVKVSIGGLAFTLEEDAYFVLDNYLKALRTHFARNPESEEIISDIESRLSELLQMRISANDGVVSINDAEELIKIMGNPKDFDDSANSFASADNTTGSNSLHGRNPEFEKKLLRDLDNKIIGGVCSGLGHYFKIDPTAIRLIFAGLFLLLFFVGYRMPSCMLIVGIYIILWIVMPAARTFKQKLAMTGDDPSILNIEERGQPANRKYKGSSVNRVLNILLNIIVGFIAVITFIILISFIIVLVWLYFDTDIVGLSNYMMILGYDVWNFKISLVIAFIFPILGFFILLVKLLRRTPFTSGSFVSFIICLILWLGAVFYLGNKGFGFAYSHKEDTKVVEQISASTTSDTLYVKLGTDYLNRDHLPHNRKFIYKGDRMKDREICILPNVRIKDATDTLTTNYKIEITKRAFGSSDISAGRKAEALELDYALSDSVLTINPAWYNENKTWNLETFDIIIIKPQGKTVIADDDLTKIRFEYSAGRYKYHGFGNSYYFDTF